MADSGTLQRAASTVRCAVAGTPMRGFRAPHLSGPRPHAGRVIECVEAGRRGVTLVWDDGLVLETPVRHRDDWQVFALDRAGRTPGRVGAPTPGAHADITILTDDWAAVCATAAPAASYHLPDRRRHPAMGPPGPDLTAADVATSGDLETAAARLLRACDPSLPIADALLDTRIVRGLGNTYRSEALWLAAISPFAPLSALDLHDVERVLLAAVDVIHTHVVNADEQTPPLRVYGRNGRRCERCATSIAARLVGRQHQTIYWCPECQRRHDPFLAVRDDTPTMDPHPAALRFLADLPWNRTAEHPRVERRR